MSDIATLSAARYGKTNVRVFRIVREGSWHHIVEYFVETLLEGEIATRYEIGPFKCSTVDVAQLH